MGQDLDEPLSNLDAKLRHEMRVEIRALQQRLGMATVYVTHDQTEAMSMADQVILMRDGAVAARSSCGALRPSGNGVRGWIHRHTADEPAGAGGGRGCAGHPWNGRTCRRRGQFRTSDHGYPSGKDLHHGRRGHSRSDRILRLPGRGHDCQREGGIAIDSGSRSRSPVVAGRKPGSSSLARTGGAFFRQRNRCANDGGASRAHRGLKQAQSTEREGDYQC